MNQGQGLDLVNCSWSPASWGLLLSHLGAPQTLTVSVHVVVTQVSPSISVAVTLVVVLHVSAVVTGVAKVVLVHVALIHIAHKHTVVLGGEKEIAGCQGGDDRTKGTQVACGEHVSDQRLISSSLVSGRL